MSRFIDYKKWVDQCVEDLDPNEPVMCGNCNGDGDCECFECGNYTDCQDCDGGVIDFEDACRSDFEAEFSRGKYLRKISNDALSYCKWSKSSFSEFLNDEGFRFSICEKSGDFTITCFGACHGCAIIKAELI